VPVVTLRRRVILLLGRRRSYAAPVVLVVAHRGASTARPPGNTIEAFRAARSLGADWVELDVRPTADGALAVHHDADLPDGRAVAEVPARELPAWVPLLDSALDACAGMGVNVELKADCPPDAHAPMVEAVAGELRRRGEPARWLLTSFDWALMVQARALAPELPTGLLFFHPELAGPAVAEATREGHVAVNPWDPAVDERFVAIARGAGVAVNVWTVDDPVRIRELVALGVDAVITNVPDLCRAVVDGSVSEG
jgi:glycerophosphoryl diester phosphodiesterase